MLDVDENYSSDIEYENNYDNDYNQINNKNNHNLKEYKYKDKYRKVRKVLFFMPSAIPAKMFPKNGQSDLDNYRLQVEILQQKLAKSEEQRQQLEEKFDKIQKKRNEHDKSIKTRSRVKFEEFLEKQRERNERNKKIIRMLEHIDQQAALLSQRSSRLKAMKRQYELYFARLLQSQAFRIQNSPRYSYLPINQFTMQPHGLMPIYDSKGKPLGYTSISGSSQNYPGLIQPTNLYPESEDLSKPNSSIPLISTMPATPPGAITPRISGSRQQPSSGLLEMNNWNYLTPNNNYPISNISNISNNFMGNLPSPRYPLNNFANYATQPNQFDFYRRGPAMYNPNDTQVPILSQQNMMPEQWGLPSRSLSDSGRSFTDIGMTNTPNKSDSADMLGTVTQQKTIPTNQRTFKDFDKSGIPNRNVEKKIVGEPHSLPSDYDFSKATEDDLNLLRELTTRNRLRTFNDSNENLSRNDSMQDLYPYSSRNTSQDPEARPYLAADTRQRSPSRFSHSRSSSMENKTHYSPVSRDPHQDENYMMSDCRNDTMERSPSESLITSFSNIHLGNNDNSVNEKQMNMKSGDPDRLQSTLNNRISPSIEDRQHEISTLNRSPHVENKFSPATSKQHNQHQQRNLENGGEFTTPTPNTLPTPEAVASSLGTKHIPSNNDRIIIPSNPNLSSSNVNTYPNNNNNGTCSPSLSSPLNYTDSAVTAAADKKQRPALLKKIQLPNYLAPKGNAEKNKLSNERTDADIMKLHQPSGIDSSPLQFAKKEKLSLENIENAIYGELINPEMPMSSVDGHDPVSQILRHHQTPAEIIAETNQGRKPILENFKPKLSGFKEVLEPNDQKEKLDINEKILRNKIEIGNPKPIHLNIEKTNIEQSILKPEISPGPPVEQIIPKTEKPPEPQGQENLENTTAKILQDTPYDNYNTSLQENQPIYNNDPINNIQPDKQSTFDYENPVAENQSTEVENSYTAQEQYQTDADTVNSQQPLDNQTYDNSQDYTNSNTADPNLYQTDQQQYDNTQDYQQYNEQNYTPDQQNTYENYPTDPNAYQAEYDPNAYNYNYDQQQQGDGTYAAYDPNQQYSEQDYNQQAYQQDPNYSDQQYAQQGYTDDQNISNQSDPNQYDYSQQQDIPIEGYDQQQQLASQDQPMTENQSEPIIEQQQLEPSSVPTPNVPPTTGNPTATAKSKSVKPILTKEKSMDVEHKKKKRVNFVDSSDESSSKGQQQQQQQQLATTDESDFDFSSQ